MAGEKDEIVPCMQAADEKCIQNYFRETQKVLLIWLQDNIKFMLRERNRMNWEEWIQLVQWQSLLNIPMNFRGHKNGNFFECLSKHDILTKCYVILSYCFMYLVLFCICPQTRMFSLPKTEILSDGGTVTSLAKAPPTRRIKMQEFILVTKCCLSRLQRRWSLMMYQHASLAYIHDTAGISDQA